MLKFVVLFLLALPQLPALAASFNCDHAATKMEQMVCSDAALSRADDELAAAYARALKAADDPEAVKKQQREWLHDADHHCDSVDCLKSAYARRIKQLAGASGQPATQATEARK